MSFSALGEMPLSEPLLEETKLRSDLDYFGKNSSQGKVYSKPFYVEHYYINNYISMATAPDMDAADAIYQLIVVGKDVFARALVGRNKTSK